MENILRMEILKRLSNLKRDSPRHPRTQGLKISRVHELLQITPCHVLHDDKMGVFIEELFLESHYIWTIFALDLQANLSFYSSFLNI